MSIAARITASRCTVQKRNPHKLPARPAPALSPRSAQTANIAQVGADRKPTGRGQHERLRIRTTLHAGHEETARHGRQAYLSAPRLPDDDTGNVLSETFTGGSNNADIIDTKRPDEKALQKERETLKIMRRNIIGYARKHYPGYFNVTGNL